MTIGEFVRNRRKELGLTVDELAEKMGKNRATIYRYESNYIKKLPSTVLIPLANALQVTPADLINAGEEETTSPDISSIKNIVTIHKKKIPVIGTIAAGRPIYADEHIETYVPCDEDIDAQFGLIIRGDSMIGAEIYDGDIVFIKEQPVVENGQIAAVRIDDEATLKRFYKTPDGCMLVSENPKYPPMYFNADNCTEVHIIGLAVAKYSLIKQ